MTELRERLYPESYIPATRSALERINTYEQERIERFREYNFNWDRKTLRVTKNGINLGVIRIEEK